MPDLAAALADLEQGKHPAKPQDVVARQLKKLRHAAERPNIADEPAAWSGLVTGGGGP